MAKTEKDILTEIVVDNHEEEFSIIEIALKIELNAKNHRFDYISLPQN